jgi:GNAT superfamily N-acetyltransferase
MLRVVCEDEPALKQIGLKYKLYVNHHSYIMKEWLQTKKIISGKIAYYNNIPIGISVVIEAESYDRYNCGVYVKSEYRRKGIGTQLVSNLGDIYVCAETPSQKKFWSKNETACIT